MRELTRAQSYFFPLIASSVNTVLEVNPYFGDFAANFNDLNPQITYSILPDYKDMNTVVSMHDLIYAREFCHFHEWRTFFKESLMKANKNILVDITLTPREAIIDASICYYIIDGEKVVLSILNQDDVLSFLTGFVDINEIVVYVYPVSETKTRYPYDHSEILKGSLLINKKTQNVSKTQKPKIQFI